ncbi:MAG TPA: ABC transporter ATP-binding protein [Stellaceae bacterium]|nr:ABC transporter ATP-binding protein [Stellaceae bacterium]
MKAVVDDGAVRGIAQRTGQDRSQESLAKMSGGRVTGDRGVSAGEGVAAVRLSRITHRFGNFTALNDVSLEVRPGEFVTLLGQSGSGKSTLLRIIAGLTTPSEGQVFIDGVDVSAFPTQRRGVGFVFQNYALFPHLTVFENIAYPLRIRAIKQPEIQRRVEQALARVNLHGLGDRYASQLSGGQQQRVAVARALVYEPSVLLMDEPLGALDRKLRKHMQIELRQLQQDLRISCVYVTHDQEEALTMSDRIAVMQAGRIFQIGDPVTVYRHPVSSLVADFVGSTNLFECRVREVASDGSVLLETSAKTQFRVASFPGVATGLACRVAVRPEFIRIDEAPAEIAFAARVAKVTFVGNVIDIQCALDTGELISVEIGGNRKDLVAVGERIRIGWDGADMGIFPASRQDQETKLNQRGEGG